jgi:hypothetical protein
LNKVNPVADEELINRQIARQIELKNCLHKVRELKKEDFVKCNINSCQSQN